MNSAVVWMSYTIWFFVSYAVTHISRAALDGVAAHSEVFESIALRVFLVAPLDYLLITVTVFPLSVLALHKWILRTATVSFIYGAGLGVFLGGIPATSELGIAWRSGGLAFVF